MSKGFAARISEPKKEKKVSSPIEAKGRLISW